MSDTRDIGITVFLANIPTLACIVGAIVLWCYGITQGPGWLLFVGLLISKTWSSNDKEKENLDSINSKVDKDGT